MTGGADRDHARRTPTAARRALAPTVAACRSRVPPHGRPARAGWWPASQPRRRRRSASTAAPSCSTSTAPRLPPGPAQAVLQRDLRRRAAHRRSCASTGTRRASRPREGRALRAASRDVPRRRRPCRATIVRPRPALGRVHDAEPVDRRRAARDRAPVRAHRPADGRDRLRRARAGEPGGDPVRSEHGATGHAVAFADVGGADERTLSTLIAPRSAARSPRAEGIARAHPRPRPPPLAARGVSVPPCRP